VEMLHLHTFVALLLTVAISTSSEQETMDAIDLVVRIVLILLQVIIAASCSSWRETISVIDMMVHT